jgi:hypothetical protein
LKKYSDNYFEGKALVADVQWNSAVQKLSRFARDCNVHIYVTSSYRPDANVADPIVPPASRSNHMIGRAVDMNLKAADGSWWCNSGCLGDISSAPSGARCFINKVQSDATLRWGQSFNDPVHIDESTNNRDSALWDQRYAATSDSYRRHCY